MSAIIEFNGITKTYKDKLVLNSLNLEVTEKDFTLVYGLPGSGRSVLFRLLMGLEKPTEGQILLRGEDIASLSPEERHIGYVPQSFALFPHMKVYDNIAYPLKLMKVGKEETKRLVYNVSEMLNISDLLDKFPHQTSGGQKQRIAIARGIVKQTDVFVLDDPLVGLDFKLREQLIDDLKVLQSRLGHTFLYTTSDPLEALSLAQTLAILHDGRVIEKGGPMELYENAQTLDCMRILGFPSANVIEGEAQEGKFVTKAFEMPVNKDEGTQLCAVIRPEFIRMEPTSDDGINLKARVLLNEDLGGEEIVYFDVDGTRLTATFRHDEFKPEWDIDSHVQIFIAPSDICLFDKESGRRIQ